MFDFDGAGNVTASFKQYASNKGGAGPKVSSGTASGTYNVNTDGTGTINLTTIGQTFAFAIDSTATSAERIELINTSSKSWSCALSGYAIQQ